MAGNTNTEKGKDRDKQEFFTGTSPLCPDFLLSFRSGKAEAADTATCGELQFFRHDRFGFILTVNGRIRLTESGEFVYHEMLAHIPMYAHESPSDVLILGGGTGGLAREILKHPCVERLDICESDEEFLEFCRKNLPWMRKTLRNSKTDVFHENPLNFLKQHLQTYDLILTDFPDPFSKGDSLLTDEFLSACRNALKPGGVFAAPLGSALPGLSGLNKAVRIFTDMKKIFRYPMCYSFPLLTTPGSPLCVGIASDTHETDRPARMPFRRFTYKLKAYSAAVHKAAFTLPPYLKKSFDHAED